MRSPGLLHHLTSTLAISNPGMQRIKSQNRLFNLATPSKSFKVSVSLKSKPLSSKSASKAHVFGPRRASAHARGSGAGRSPKASAAGLYMQPLEAQHPGQSSHGAAARHFHLLRLFPDLLVEVRQAEVDARCPARRPFSLPDMKKVSRNIPKG